MNNPQEVKEMNEVISQIQKVLQPDAEIGIQDKTTLNHLLHTNRIDKKVKFFPCKRHLSEKVVKHFVHVKGVLRNKFSSNMKEFIYVIYSGGSGVSEKKESASQKTPDAMEKKAIRKKKTT